MNLGHFIHDIMNENYTIKFTICGSMRNKELMKKYCAYYTIKNNVVFMPIDYLTIKDIVETFDGADNYFKKYREESHNQKILLSDAIIVVTGEDGYYGSDTLREIEFARKENKIILFTTKCKDSMCWCNHDLNFPLYVFKEDLGWLS